MILALATLRNTDGWAHAVLLAFVFGAVGGVAGAAVALWRTRP